jgi:hypothetical protein
MAGMRTDYPEHLDAGLKPKSPGEVYYFARTPQRANRIVDITNYIDKKVEANMLNVTKGPAGRGRGRAFKESLAKEGKKLAILGDDESKVDHNYVKNIVFDIDSRRLNFSNISNRQLGEQYGLGWAERFHYIGPAENRLEKYIEENSVRIK